MTEIEVLEERVRLLRKIVAALDDSWTAEKIKAFLCEVRDTEEAILGRYSIGMETSTRERILIATKFQCAIRPLDLARFYGCRPVEILPTLAAMVEEGVLQVRDGLYSRPGSPESGLTLQDMARGAEREPPPGGRA